MIDEPPVAPAVNGTDTVAAPVYACPVETVGVPIVGACGIVVAVIAEEVPAADVLMILVAVAETV